MDDAIADHLAKTDLTTLAPVLGHERRATARSIRSQNGYKRITGRPRRADDPGSPRPRRPRRTRLHQLRLGPQRAPVRGAGRRSSRTRRSRRSSPSPRTWASTASTWTSSACGLENVPAYGAFVERLRAALREANPDGAGLRGHDSRAAGRRDGRRGHAAAAGADRIFLMGYDYRTRQQRARRLGADGPPRRQRAGPRLVARPVRGARRAGRADDPRPAAVRRDLAGRRSGARRGAGRRTATPGSRPTTSRLLASPPVPPETDPIEIVEFYAIPPADGATPDPSDGSPAARLAGRSTSIRRRR